jgi:esterase/lipase
MTSRSEHLAQLERTPWAVPAYTVRFYHALSVMVGSMMPQAAGIRQPVFIVHAANDVFASEASVRAFVRRLPSGQLKIYPESHHLLFYDKEKDKVVADVVGWVGRQSWKVAD